MACRRRCHKIFFLLLFSSRKNTNTGSPHHSGALRRVKFDIFWLEGDGILLTLCKNANQNVSKCAWSFPSNPHFFPPPLSLCMSYFWGCWWIHRNIIYGKSTLFEVRRRKVNSGNVDVHERLRGFEYLHIASPAMIKYPQCRCCSVTFDDTERS